MSVIVLAVNRYEHFMKNKKTSANLHENQIEPQRKVDVTGWTSRY